MKTRLLGAAVLIALAVLFVPMFFSSSPPAPGGDQAVNLAIPPAPDRDLQTRTMSLTPDAPTGAAPAAGASSTSVTPAAADQLATVNIGSNRPRDVETDPLAGSKPAPTTVTVGSGASPSQPVIVQRNAPGAGVPAASKPEVPVLPGKTTAVPVVTSPTPTVAVPAAGRGNYSINLSAYASASGAASLQRRVHALGYPVALHAISQGGQPRTLVIGGPFETRAAAEAARLKIIQSIPGVPARLEQDASHDGAAPAATPAAAAAKPGAPTLVRAGGWAVQLAAMSNQADATALREKLRASGFDGFVDTVQSSGKKLWRVRAGPQTQRADAQRVHDQIKAKLGIDGNIVSVP